MWHQIHIKHSQTTSRGSSSSKTKETADNASETYLTILSYKACTACETLACIWARGWCTATHTAAVWLSASGHSRKGWRWSRLSAPFPPIPPPPPFPDDDVVVHLVHSPLNNIFSLHNLEVASSPCVSCELESHSRVKPELSCWPEASFASGHGAVIPDWNTLGCILQMTYQGQLGIKCCPQRMMLMTFRIIKLEFLKKQVCFHTKVDRLKDSTGYCSFY